MPTCFVSIITLSKNNFDDLDNLPEEQVQKFLDLREIEYSNIETLMFALVKHGGITKSDVNEMTYPEMLRWYELIRKQNELDSKK